MKDEVFDNLIKEITIAFKEKKNVDAIIVFGSVARGEAGEGSYRICFSISKKNTTKA